jgi:hypothetical protein
VKGAMPDDHGEEKDPYLQMILGAVEPAAAADVHIKQGGNAVLLKNEPRANYSYEIHGNVIAIIDPDDGGKSVTNDAENVIADFAANGFDLSKYRVIYRDTRGIWDEMLVRDGAFVDFRSINERELSDALAKDTLVADTPQHEQRRGRHL